ncbi:hypothetical protein [Capnocytophaga canis]|uniref:hypothetical protein n=1 Tax=Capnocytophaga canis TaxID=1848903 RepID=UPI0037D66DCC
MKNQRVNYAEILDNLLSYLQMNASQLSDELGYKSKSSLYQIKNEGKEISPQMARRICQKYPEINFMYLATGEGELINATNDLSTQLNMLHQPAPTLLDIPILLHRQNEILEEISETLKNLYQNSENTTINE